MLEGPCLNLSLEIGSAENFMKSTVFCDIELCSLAEVS